MLPSAAIRNRDKRRIAEPANGTVIERIASSFYTIARAPANFEFTQPLPCVRCGKVAQRNVLRNIGSKGREAYVHRSRCGPG